MESRRTMRVVCSAILLTLLVWSVRPAAAASSCESLAALSLPRTTITLAQSVGAGEFTPPAGRGRAGAD